MAVQFDSSWTDVPPPVPVPRLPSMSIIGWPRSAVLTEDDRVELLEGWIVPKQIRSPGHDGVLHQVSDLLADDPPGGPLHPRSSGNHDRR